MLHLASTVNSKESLLDISTSLITTDGSLTFSPILQALRLQDGSGEAMGERQGQRKHYVGVDVTLYEPGEVKNICCVGAGYVGGPTAAVMAFHNPHIKVTVVDRDSNRIAQWQTKHPPIYEPGLQEILRIARDGSKASSFSNKQTRIDSLEGFPTASSSSSRYESQFNEHRGEISMPSRQPNLFFSNEVSKNISEADIILIAVNTPTKSTGLGAGRATDVTALKAVTEEIAVHAKPGAILVEKSTVPCRTADDIQTTLKAHRPHINLEVLSNPEFLAAGAAMNGLLRPDRVIIGSSNTPSGHRAAAALAAIYASWVPRSKIITMNIWSSELSKLVANSMLAQRISSINSVSAICEEIGADVNEVAKSIGLDPRIGNEYLKAGLGFGGSCFKKDILSLVYLAESLGLEEVAEYWQQVLKINEFQRTRFIRRVFKCLNGTLAGKKLALLGYAFKKDTNDTRESLTLESIKVLLEDTPSQIAIFDPCCNPTAVRDEICSLLGANTLKENGGPIKVYADAYQACHNSHAVIVMTDCEEFKNTRAAKSPELGANPKYADPRPFQRLEPSEAEILTLREYLAANTGMRDPLRRYIDEPVCDEGCIACRGEIGGNASRKVNGEEVQEKENERLDWARIVYYLMEPRWVFDGRGVLDVAEIEALGIGVRLEEIGRVGRSGFYRR